MAGRSASRAALGPLLALLAGCNPERPVLHSPVYVQDVRADRATICELSRRADARALDWGRAPPLFTGRLSEGAPRTHHRFTLQGLDPDTTYHYRLLGSDGAVVHEAAFRTAPLAGRRPVRLLAVSDTGDDRPRYPALKPLDEVVEVFGGHGRGGSATQDVFGIEERRPSRPQGATVATMLASTPDAELVLHGGDLVGPDRTRGSYRRAYLEPFAPLIDHLPVFPVLGNHDHEVGQGATWRELFQTPGGPDGDGATRRYYAFDWGDVHVLALDDSGPDASFAPGAPQRVFLDDDLARSRAAWKVVLLHVPPFRALGLEPDTLVSDLAPALERGGVQLVLAGHEHAYERFHPRNGVTYVTLGTGGQWHPRIAPLTSRLAAVGTGYMFARITADERTLRLEALLAGAATVIDEVTLVR